MLLAIVAVALLALAALGGVIAGYFSLVTYRVIRADNRFVPHFCRMDPPTCSRVVDAPEARALGLPNSVYGLAWFAIVAASAVAALARGSLAFANELLVASAFTVLFSAWLASQLIWKLKTKCVLCFTSHGINAAILALLALARFTG